MEKLTQNNDLLLAKQAATGEGIILPEQLLQEIQPLLKEYFLGEFDIKQNLLNMNFFNGKKFALKIEEVS